ncbi:chemotaxis protein CheD [Desulforapulum autotrophicum]|nr:chemotaxis protein CheD [Desulforapulum autotrophicum]
MNHFIFPYIATKGKTTPLYGNIATIVLLKMMLTQESSPKFLEAQIYGGAYHPEKNNIEIGRENIEIARKILMRNQIPITSQDVGGEKGRKVIFNTKTNEVAILKVDRLRDMDWYPYQ